MFAFVKLQIKIGYLDTYKASYKMHKVNIWANIPSFDVLGVCFYELLNMNEIFFSFWEEILRQ